MVHAILFARLNFFLLLKEDIQATNSRRSKLN